MLGYDKAEFSVFDKMEDAVLYVQSSGGGKARNRSAIRKPQKKRKRTATLTFEVPESKKRKPEVPKHDLMLPEKEKLDATAMVTANEEVQNYCDNSIEDAPVAIQEDSRELYVILEEGYAQNRPKGWRSGFLFPDLQQDREAWGARYLQDVNILKQYRHGRPSISRDVHNTKHISGVPNAFSLAYLNWAWGVGEAYHRYLAFQQKRRPFHKRRRKPIKQKVKDWQDNAEIYNLSRHGCVITNREAARRRFTAKAMFVSFRVQQLAEVETNGKRKEDLPGRPGVSATKEQSPLVNGCSRKKEWMEEARADFDKLSDGDKAYWKEEERKHDERQPEILGILQAAMRKDSRRSAKKLSEDIGFWCGKTTIGKWKSLTVGPTYRKGLVQPLNNWLSPDPSVSNVNIEASLSGHHIELHPTEVDLEKDGHDDNTMDDEMRMCPEEDGNEKSEKREEKKPSQPVSMGKENEMPEETKQFLASISTSDIVKKKEKNAYSLSLPIRIFVSTNKYTDAHVSSLVSDLEPNISVALNSPVEEVKGHYRETDSDEEEHLVI